MLVATSTSMAEEARGMSEKTKTLTITDAELKADGDAKGEVRAVFATLDVVDSHGDIIERGAIKNQSVTMAAYNHDSWWAGGQPSSWPVGKGRVYEDGDKAVFEGKLFMDMEHGEETFKLLRNMGRQQEWSFSLEDIKADRDDAGHRRIKRVKVHEVSPVFKGAGKRTRTVSVKEAGMNDKPEADYKAEIESLEAKVDALTKERDDLAKQVTEARTEHARDLYKFAEREAPAQEG